jgi:hypothetical protein
VERLETLERVRGNGGLAEVVKALTTNIASLNNNVRDGIEQLGRRTPALPADLADRLNKARAAGKIDEKSITGIVREFLVARGVTVADTLVQELTRTALCFVVEIACSSTVTVHTAPITVSPTPVTVTAPPPTVIIERADPREPGSTSGRSELRLYMSVWFPRVNSTDEQGAVEKTIVPRIKWRIGSRQDCKIFVVGNADSSGSDSYNRRLSERRAAVVVRLLQKAFGKMVDPNPMAGGERSLFNWSIDGRQDLYNRRADILVSCG